MNKVEIHVTQLPYANLATMTVSIPGHDSYRETFSAHPDNLTEASAKLLRRVANDYAALLVKSSTTHEAPEGLGGVYIDPQLVKLQDQLEFTQNELRDVRRQLGEAKAEIVDLQSRWGDAQDAGNKSRRALMAVLPLLIDRK